MRKINHIFIILFLTILFLFSVYFIKFLRENVFFFLISLLIINLIIYFFVNLPNKKYDISLILFLLISIIASRLIFNNLDQSTLILRTSSILSFFILHLILLIGPWSKFSDSIIKIYHFRRHLGVTVFFLGTLHVVIILPRYFSYSIKGALSSIFIFYGLTSFFLLFWLAITSWDHLQKKVKDMTWKAIHLILLLIYISISYYMYTIQKTFNESTLNYHLIVIGIFILIWIIIAPYSFIKKIMSTNIFGWKQLHVLIWIVYSSLLLHVYFGPLSTTNNLVKTIFWVSIITIISSHVVGWVKRFYEDKGINDKINSINKTININNKDYVGVDHINNFKEGEGKKFYVNKKQIAVFKYKNNFIAISNICAHQKGPLYKGKINSGYVECPWHQWQYNIKDGCGPPGFSDCVPYYDAKVVKDILFISKDHSKNK